MFVCFVLFVCLLFLQQWFDLTLTFFKKKIIITENLKLQDCGLFFMQSVYLIFQFALIEPHNLKWTNQSKTNQKSKEKIVKKPEDVTRGILFGWRTIGVKSS